MDDRIVIVGCGKVKRDSESLAWLLYDSGYAHLKMTVAILVGQPYIASAKHGLVPPNERVEPYQKSIYELSAAERRELGRQIAADIPDHFDEVLFLAGKKYRNPIIEALDDSFDVINPFESDELGGQGDQQGWLKQAAQDLVDGESLEGVLP